MPFGLLNAPATFEWSMEAVLCELIGKIRLVYLNDGCPWADSSWTLNVSAHCVQEAKKRCIKAVTQEMPMVPEEG